MAYPATCAAAFTMDSFSLNVLLTLVEHGMTKQDSATAVLFVVWQRMLP